MYDKGWPIWTYQQQLAPAKFVDADNRPGSARDSLVSGGCIVSGATVTRSVLFSGVHARSGAAVDLAVVLPDVDIGKGAHLSRVVIDRGCVIPPGMVIGDDPALDAKRFYRTDNGVVLVNREMLAAL
jgi:glucose-1-phosphate adenylyltransferase